MTRARLWTGIALGAVGLVAVGFVTFFQLSGSGVSNAPGGMPGTAFRYRNDFATPDEVVRYYVGRDASGYVWHGLLDAEREAFTTWEVSPQSESFLVANIIEIEPSEIESSKASILVRYKIQYMSDGNAILSAVPAEDRLVTFYLELSDDRWQIVSPSPSAIQPVVLASSVPFLGIADRAPEKWPASDDESAKLNDADGTVAETPEQRMASVRSEALLLETTNTNNYFPLDVARMEYIVSQVGPGPEKFEYRLIMDVEPGEIINDVQFDKKVVITMKLPDGSSATDNTRHYAYRDGAVYELVEGTDEVERLLIPPTVLAGMKWDTGNSHDELTHEILGFSDVFLQEDKYVNCLTIKSIGEDADGLQTETTVYYAPSIGLVKQESEITTPHDKSILSMVLVEVH